MANRRPVCDLKAAQVIVARRRSVPTGRTRRLLHQQSLIFPYSPLVALSPLSIICGMSLASHRHERSAAAGTTVLAGHLPGWGSVPFGGPAVRRVQVHRRLSKQLLEKTISTAAAMLGARAVARLHHFSRLSAHAATG